MLLNGKYLLQTKSWHGVIITSGIPEISIYIHESLCFDAIRFMSYMKMKIRTQSRSSVCGYSLSNVMPPHSFRLLAINRCPPRNHPGASAQEWTKKKMNRPKCESKQRRNINWLTFSNINPQYQKHTFSSHTDTHIFMARQFDLMPCVLSSIVYPQIHTFRIRIIIYT